MLKLTKDHLFHAALWFSGLSLIVLFVIFNYGILVRGGSAVSAEFLLSSPERAGRSGGISSIIVSTLFILSICLVVAVPISVGAAILLAEFTTRTRGIGHWLGLSLDILAGIPSIVFGLFGNALFCRVFGLGFSILSGGLTLACMVFPILIRSVEESLRAVSNDFRLGAEALALSKFTMVMRILLPAAVPGICVGVVLGIGRALGETAALLFTSGYVDRMPTSIFDSGRSLAIHIYDLAMNVPGGEPNAYRAAFVLLVLILAINSAIAILGQRWFNVVRGAF